MTVDASPGVLDPEAEEPHPAIKARRRTGGDEASGRMLCGTMQVYGLPVRCGLLLIAPFVVLAAGCASPPSRDAVSAPHDEWHPLTWEERHDAMTFRVLPNMARLFQRFQQKAVPDMTCRTCHGPDAEQAAYAMPHGLPVLDPDHMPDPHDRVVRFMTDEVSPTMADLVGIDRGHFSCFDCHPRKR
jgi:hypothetical protein